MPYVCPTCAHPTLPPAVEPSKYRLCRKCGERFHPDAAIAPQEIVDAYNAQR